MDFDWSEGQKAYRARIRAFLAEALPADWPQIARHGPGSPEQTAFSLEFCPKLAAAGLLVPHWPDAWGGQGGTAWEHFILGEEMWAAGEPRGAQYMNVNWIGPTLMHYGSAAQQARYIPPMAAGKAIWCQGFSEPNAGSDLAALRTMARREGDDYVINGTKIWTSYAGLAETCFLLARTGTADGSSDAGKGGIAIFLVPMDSAGIQVRAIPSLIGHGDIHECFFTDVRVPATARLGAEGEAWSIITYSLANERIGIPRYAFGSNVLGEMVGEVQRRGAFDDALIRARAGAALAACDAAKMLVYRAVALRAEGQALGAHASLARVAVIAAEQAVAQFGLDFLPDTFTGGDFASHLAHHERAIVTGIAAGAAELQLGLIARNWLNLPKEAR